MTAADVARELGLAHANASYQVRQLHAAGTIRANTTIALFDMEP